MKNLRSCHLIVHRKFPDDCRHVCELIDDDFFVGGGGGGISTLFLEWTLSTNANIFSYYYALWGKHKIFLLLMIPLLHF